jgi:hypothetical protein
MERNNLLIIGGLIGIIIVLVIGAYTHVKYLSYY